MRPVASAAASARWWRSLVCYHGLLYGRALPCTRREFLGVPLRGASASACAAQLASHACAAPLARPRLRLRHEPRQEVERINART